MKAVVINELLIGVHAASVNPLDWKIRSGMLRMLTGRGFNTRPQNNLELKGERP